MRQLFFEHHRPTAAEFEVFWRDGIFSFDASVLLDLYRFSLASRQELVETLEKKRDQIWITYQAAFEFHKRRLEVISETHKRADRLTQKMEELIASLEGESTRHPYIDNAITIPIIEALKAGIESIGRAKSNPLTDDTIGVDVLRILDGRVAQPYSAEKLKELCPSIDARFDAKTPPGYMDKKEKEKPGNDGDPRGDAIIWFQLMDLAKAHKSPIIFVTRDLKEDWWTRVDGKTIQARHELRREFFEATGQHFLLYQTPQFVEYAKLSPKLQSEAELLSRNAFRAEVRQLNSLDQDSEVGTAASSPGSTSDTELRSYTLLRDLRRIILKMQENGADASGADDGSEGRSGRTSTSPEEQ